MSAEPTLIQSRHGPLYAHPDDRYLGEACCRYGEYSELEYRFLADVLGPDDGRLLVEVGANAGYLSVPLLKHGRLACFEPQPYVFSLLRKNVSENVDEINSFSGGYFESKGLSNPKTVCDLYDMAVGEARGEISVPLHSYETPGNHGGIPLTKDQSHAAMKAIEWVKAPLTAIDYFCTRPTRFIKADVEGMELNVLRGARQVISRDKPLLYLENDRPAQSAELIRYVWKLGYWCAWHCPPMFNPDNFFKVKQNIYGNKASVNMICVPNGQTLPPGVGRKHELKLVEDVKLHPVTGM